MVGPSATIEGQTRTRTNAIFAEDEAVDDGSFHSTWLWAISVSGFQLYYDYSQGSRTVHDYTVEYLRLADLNNLRKTEDQWVAKFLNGLKAPIQDKIELQVVSNFKRAHNLALKAEALERHASDSVSYHKKPVRFITFSRQQSAMQGDAENYTPTQLMLQQSQGRNDAPATQASGSDNQKLPRTSTNPYARPTSENCYRCIKPDHCFNICLEFKLIILVEDVVDKVDKGMPKMKAMEITMKLNMRKKKWSELSA